MPSNDFFSGATLAADQDSHVGLGDPSRQGRELPSRWIHRDQATRLRAVAVQIRAHLADQHLGLEGLDEVVHGPFTHRPHRLLHRSVGGHEQHRQLGAPLLDLVQQLESVHARHLDVTHDELGLAIGEHCERGLAVAGRAGVDAGQAQRVTQGVAQRRVVLHHQHRATHRRSAHRHRRGSHAMRDRGSVKVKVAPPATEGSSRKLP